MSTERNVLFPTAVPRDPYDESTWDDNPEVPTKADIRNKIETIVSSPGPAGPGYLATSATSQNMTLLGSKAFTTQAGLAYSAGARARFSSVSQGPTYWQEGYVTSYSGTTLTVTIDRFSNLVPSGNFTDWLINLAGEPGADGAAGSPGSTGSAGTDGKTILNGTAAPTTEGVNGDFYLRTTTNVLYGPKAAGVWPAGVPLAPSTPTYISGLVVTRNSTTAINVSAGSCWDPSSGKVISYAGGNTSPSLAANKVYAVYLYDNAGTPTIDVQQEDPPSSAYAGTARQRATGNAGRYIGFFLTNGSSQIYDMFVNASAENQVEVIYNVSHNAAPFRALNGGTATTLTVITLIGCVPRYVSNRIFCVLSIDGATGSNPNFAFSIDGSANFPFEYLAYVSASGSVLPRTVATLPINPATPSIYYLMQGASPVGYLDCSGFLMTR